MRLRILFAAGAAALALAACSQRDPAAEAIAAAENALNAVYDDAEKYVPERYAEVKGELVAARKAFDEERYADAIAAVKDVPAHAEALGKEAAAAKEKHVAALNADWARLSAGWRARLDARIAALQSLRDRLDGCIGCGCLSLRACALYNPGDQCAQAGSGPRRLVLAEGSS